jgi:hypothetical protein
MNKARFKNIRLSGIPMVLLAILTSLFMFQNCSRDLGENSSSTTALAQGSSVVFTPKATGIPVNTSITISQSGGVGTFVVTSGGGSVNPITGVYKAPNSTTIATIQLLLDPTTQTYSSNASIITVTGTPESVYITPSSHTLYKGQVFTLVSGGGTPSYSFNSANTAIASVDNKSGVVTANGTGSTTITTTDAVGISGSCTITVTSCQAGAQQACSPANGTGTQTCAADGSGYGACAANSCNGGYQLSGNSCTAIPVAHPATTTLYRMFSAALLKHLSTVDTNVPYYAADGITAHVYQSQFNGNIAQIYRCYHGISHFTSRDSNCEGFGILEGPLGWVDSVQGSGEVPLYRLVNQSLLDFMDSTNSGEGAAYGYINLGTILGYVVP